MKYNQVIPSIRSLSNLPQGWDYGRGGHISDNVIDISIYIFNSIKLSVSAFLSYQVTPSDSGSVTIMYALEYNLFMDVVIQEDCRFGVRIEKGIGPYYDILFEKEFVSLEELQTIALNYYK